MYVPNKGMLGEHKSSEALKIEKNTLNDDYLVNQIINVLNKSNSSFAHKEKALHLVDEILFRKVITSDNTFLDHVQTD